MNLKNLRSKFIKFYDYGDRYIIRCLGLKKEVLKHNCDCFDEQKVSMYINNVNDVESFKTVLSVQGFGWSGSGAVGDLLSEFNNTFVYKNQDKLYTSNECSFNSEIYFYYMLCIDILEEVVSNYDFEDLELRMQFDWLIKNLLNNFKNRLPNRIYSIIANELFDYINILSYKKELFIVDLSKILGNGDYSIYIKRDGVNSDIFLKHTRHFFYIFFKKMSQAKEVLVLDQFLQVNGSNLDLHMRYLGDNIKQICVYRDPRDQFCFFNSYEYFCFMNGDFDNKLLYKLDNFIDNLRINFDLYTYSHPNRLMIRFEDLINDYENSITTICDFLDIDKSHHINKGKYFIPEVSRKNIGIYKNYHDQRVMDKIKEELGEYCYE